MATILRQGSRGEGVKRIQLALIKAGYALEADGIYGQKTADAVAAFQRGAGLKADSIVGPVTMERLMAEAPATEGDIEITDGHINQHITFSAWRPLKYIAIHSTSGSSSRRGMAMQNRGVFLKKPSSADFVVDDETVVQVNPDPRNYYCWAGGDKKNPCGGGGTLYGKATNKNTISIEICSTLAQGTTDSEPNHDGWSFTEKVLDRALLLVRRLMREYGIPKENVVRHYDISGKACPGIPGWNDAALYTTAGKITSDRNDSREWEKFKAAL